MLPALVRAAAAAAISIRREAADEILAPGRAVRYPRPACRRRRSRGQAALAEGDVEAAVESFRHAADLAELQAPYEAAQARAWLGRALLDRRTDDTAALSCAPPSPRSSDSVLSRISKAAR